MKKIMINHLKWGILTILYWNVFQFIGYLFIPSYNLITFIFGVVISLIAFPIAWLFCVTVDCIRLKHREKKL